MHLPPIKSFPWSTTQNISPVKDVAPSPSEKCHVVEDMFLGLFIGLYKRFLIAQDIEERTLLAKRICNICDKTSSCYRTRNQIDLICNDVMCTTPPLQK